MKKIVLFSPAISSLNLGDQIIVNSIKEVMNELFSNSYLVEMSTHTPISIRYLYYLRNVDYKFVCGSNILMGKINSKIHVKQWFIEKIYHAFMKDSILIGAGWQTYKSKLNKYTLKFYQKSLSSTYIHSVRDNMTQQKLNAINITNVINTGCPSMWMLTEKHCKEIPIRKSSRVVFTVTDYSRDIDRDKKMIRILFQKYQEVFVWQQGYNDDVYLDELLSKIDNIHRVNPNLESFDKLLLEGDIDYVGTRLHAGIRALQQKVRTIIIGIDNRAIEKYKDFNLPVLVGEKIDELSDMIDSEFSTEIHLHTENIKQFMNQFSRNN